MPKYQFNEDLYVYPAPAGAYHSIATPEQTPSRRLLQGLLYQKETPKMSLDNLMDWSQESSEDAAIELLYRAQKIGWIEGIEAPKEPPAGPLEEILPGLLPNLSETGKALLADGQGFYIATSGFPHETAEALSGLSAELVSLHERRQGVLKHNLGIDTSTWGLVDAAGNSQIGFWPIYIGDQRFVLIIGGTPHLNQPDFVTLVWALTSRYGASSKKKTA